MLSHSFYQVHITPGGICLKLGPVSVPHCRKILFFNHVFHAKLYKKVYFLISFLTFFAFFSKLFIISSSDLVPHQLPLMLGATLEEKKEHFVKLTIFIAVDHVFISGINHWNAICIC